MISKNKIKFISSLKQKKYRQEFQTFVLEGEKLFDECASFAPQRLLEVFALPDWIEQKQDQLSKLNIEYHPVNARTLGRISQLKTPNNVLALGKIDQSPFVFDKAPDYAFFLDDINDPGNLGTILRISNWFGWDTLFCSPDTVDEYNSKVVQASMGAFFRTRVVRTTLEKIRNQLKNHQILGADMNGKNVFDFLWPQKAIVLIGSESHGIADENLPFVNEFVRIPGSMDSGMESLNAAVSAGILAAVIYKKRFAVNG